MRSGEWYNIIMITEVFRGDRGRVLPPAEAAQAVPVEWPTLGQDNLGKVAAGVVQAEVVDEYEGTDNIPAARDGVDIVDAIVDAEVVDETDETDGAYDSGAKLQFADARHAVEMVPHRAAPDVPPSDARPEPPVVPPEGRGRVAGAYGDLRETGLMVDSRV